MRCIARCTFFVALFATLTVARLSQGAETVWPAPDWQTATPESQGLSPVGVEKVGEWLKGAGSRTGLLVRHGRIVGEWYFEDATPASKYIVYSTTKSFASTAAGLAIEEGKLTRDTKVGQLLPEASPAGKQNVTVRQIISMSTGVHNNAQIHTHPNLFAYSLSQAPMDHEPGTKWDYNNTGLALLSPMFLKATGRSLDQYLNEKVFQPIGIKAGEWSWEKRGETPLSYSGLHITARGLARYGLLFLNKGTWQEKQVVPAAWVTEATGPSQDLNKSYGYLWWNNTTGKWPGVPADAYASLGKNDNSMLIVPSLDLVVLRQVGDYSGPPRKLNIGELWKLSCDAVTEK